ncbi:MAG: hypothetical protein GXY19_07590 [Phycisphaerae bacterium]|nr:hypothetical protein [Phycisphaerae bacterium]
MKRKLQTPIMVILLVLLPLIAFSGAEQTPSESYYERLKSLVRVREGYDVSIHPTAKDRDVNLIEIEKGAAGVVFGASMDDVIAVWRKPESIWIDGIREAWFLGIGGCEFGFVDNRLTTIAVPSFSIRKAHLANGIGFESSYDEVKSALGEPVKATDSRLRFVTKSGYTVNFDFVSDEWSSGKRRLQCIKISCPDSGEFVRSRFDRGGPTR